MPDKPLEKREFIAHKNIDQIYGAMSWGVQIFCCDGSSYTALSFTTTTSGLHGDFKLFIN